MPTSHILGGAPSQLGLTPRSNLAGTDGNPTYCQRSRPVDIRFRILRCSLQRGGSTSPSKVLQPLVRVVHGVSSSMSSSQTSREGGFRSKQVGHEPRNIPVKPAMRVQKVMSSTKKMEVGMSNSIKGDPHIRGLLVHLTNDMFY